MRGLRVISRLFRINRYFLAVVIVLLFCIFFLLYHPFKANVQYIQIPDGEIAYYMRGEGEPLILIEGFGMSMEDWDPALVRFLAKRHSVIVYDLRGVGLSKGDTTDLTIEAMAEDTSRLLQSLGIKKYSVLGWSMGSLIAQELAISHPEKVDKLILVSTFSNDEGTIDASVSNSAYIQNNLGMSWDDLFGPVLFTHDAAGNTYRDRYFSRRKTAIDSGESPRTPGVVVTVKIAHEKAMAKMKENGSRLSRLGMIKSPTLILVGDSDQLLPSKNSEIVARAIPHSKLIVAPNAGHAVLFQNSPNVKRIISEFLTEK